MNSHNEAKKTVILLGAGASMDAGVPGSTNMTQQIVEALDTFQNKRSGITHAVNYALGAMIAHRTANGASAYAGIDVEDLFSAVQMLAERETLEIAPFVQWSPTLSEIKPTPSMPAFFDRDFREGLERGTGFKTPSRMIKKAFEELNASETRATKTLYESLQKELLSALTKLVSVTDKDVSYLSPLLKMSTGTAQIATLNYDRSIELLCEQNNVSLDTGINGWTGGSDWEWSPGAEVRLLKIHGSIDWRIKQEGGLGGIPETKVVTEEDGLERHFSVPGVVFGARGKLRADGPFLSMLREFENMLSDAERLLVVGYSFRDEHINVALTRWINSSKLRDLTVIDPSFNDDPRTFGQKNFSSQLVSASTERNWVAEGRKLNLRVFNETASNGLKANDLWSKEPVGTSPNAN